MLQFDDLKLFASKNLRQIRRQQLKTAIAILIFGSLGFLTVEYSNKGKNYSGLASKPIDIRWISNLILSHTEK